MVALSKYFSKYKGMNIIARREIGLSASLPKHRSMPNCDHELLAVNSWTMLLNDWPVDVVVISSAYCNLLCKHFSIKSLGRVAQLS